MQYAFGNNDSPRSPSNLSFTFIYSAKAKWKLKICWDSFVIYIPTPLRGLSYLSLSPSFLIPPLDNPYYVSLRLIPF